MCAYSRIDKREEKELAKGQVGAGTLSSSHEHVTVALEFNLRKPKIFSSRAIYFKKYSYCIKTSSTFYEESTLNIYLSKIQFFLRISSPTLVERIISLHT